MMSASSRAPWFCPGCRRSGEEPPRANLCTHCGDPVAPQGYCPVCENFQPQSPGDLCPKHEVPLDDASPGPVAAEVSGPWVVVARYSDALACQPPRIRLEAEGIPTTLDGERMGGKAMYHVATGGVKLSVPASLETEARVILSQTWSQDAADLGIDVEDWDELDVDLGCHPSQSGIQPTPLIVLGLLMLALFLGAGLLAIVRQLVAE
ncbi:hypothetical protein [Paludisphaera soli]|uniref:hypothetical protein n=1 Tax=Paludisphaera soli TaxID=2712865 RepID=UPI0013EC7554|nr:hypothetical protein [Paludisphaera soli]